jgi:hypothetical protein
MHDRGTFRRRSLTQRLWACGLLLALAVYGFSSALVQLMGPLHFHRTVASTPTPASTVQVEDLRRSLARLDDAQAREDEHTRFHREHPFARHHHATDDASVVALDAPADSAAPDEASPAGSACLVLGLATVAAMASPAADELAWPVTIAPAPPGVTPRRFERPPRA